MLAETYLVLVCVHKSTEFKCRYLVKVCVVEIDSFLTSEHLNRLGFELENAIDLVLVSRSSFRWFLCWDRKWLVILAGGLN